MLETVKSNTEAIKPLQTRINKMRELSLDYAEVEADLNKENFEGIDERIQKIRADQFAFAEGYKKVKKLKKIMADFGIIEKEIEVAEVELVELQAKIPNVCETCGREL